MLVGWEQDLTVVCQGDFAKWGVHVTSNDGEPLENRISIVMQIVHIINAMNNQL